MGEHRLFAVALTAVILSLGAATAVVRGVSDRRFDPVPAAEIAIAEGMLTQASADRTRFTLSDETPAAEAQLKRVFGLSQPEDAPVHGNVNIACVLSPELKGIASQLVPGASYRVHYRLRTKPCEVMHIEPLASAGGKKE